MAAAIEAEGLVKLYGETRALDGLGLAVEAAIAWSILLIVVFAPLAVRLYQRRAAG